MTSQDTEASPAAARRSRGDGAEAAWTVPDARRRMQLVLAAIWLLDGILQYQSAMFTRAFGQVLARSGDGDPAVIAGPVSWAARLIEHSPATTNAAFATIQLALGLGLAWRRTLRLALAASVVWSLAVWWLGEGLGGVLTGTASPVSGAPGPVVLYALLAVLLWPAADASVAPFVAARPLGQRGARAVWVVLWGSLTYFAVQGPNRTAQGMHDMIAGLAAGEPGWLAAVNRAAAGLLAQRGLTASVGLAVVLAGIAAGVLRPGPAVRVAVAAAVAVSAVIWVVGQDLGAVLAGGATDVGSGPLLALVALAYWPRRGPAAGAGPDPTAAARGAAA